MLICNNCFTVNDDGTTVCSHCNMKDDFTHQEGKEPPKIESGISVLVCRNCGQETPEHKEKCSWCQFPMSSVTMKIDHHEKPSTIRSLKAG